MLRASIAALTATCIRAAIRLAWLTASAVGLSSVAVAQAPPGTTISNTASVEFIGSGGLTETVTSNTVDIERAIVRTPAALELLRYSTQGEIESIGPSACLRNGSSSPFPAPRGPDGAALDASLLPLADASAFHAGEAVFVRVSDADQNLDSSRRETVQVRVRVADTGDELTVQLAETAAASGVFAGYVPTTRDDSPSSDCELGATAGARLTAEYTDPSDPTDSAAGEAEFDPIGSVFDALTGLPVDGAVLTLVDADTGTEATVYGDDGRSIYPATVTAGSTIVDSAGTTYELDPGSFRFPIVPSGDYLLRIEPPTGYRAPTTRSAAELQSLDGAPFVLVAGSFGNRFTVGDSPLVAMDVPVDPAEGDLFLSIAASAAVAAPGDFVEFRLALSHNGGLVGAEDVVIRNQLPPGLRYETGTAFVRDGDVTIEPLLSADGRTLEFPVGALPGGESVEIVYVAAVVPGSRGSALTNGAVAQSSERESNFASARVALIDDFFTDTGFIAGRVTVGQCLTTGRLPTADEQAGFAGVRVYLEDGRFAVTDAGGRYHFEGIDPGTHVVQIDVDSIGPEYELIDCGGLEFAGSSVSRFIDLAPGQLRRADFTIARKPPPSGSVTLSMTQSLREAAGGDRYEFELTVGTDDDIRTGDVELMLMLPPALRFDGASDSLGNPIAAQTTDDIVLLPLGNRDGPWSESLRVRASAEPQASGELATRSLARFMFDGKRQSTPVAETRADVTPGAVVERSYSLNLTFDTLSASLNEIDRSRLDEVLAELRGIEGVRLEAIGHSDSVPISVAGQARFADNYVLSAARARAAVEYLRTGLSLDANRVRYAGLGPDQPVASNATTAGRSMNRRVDLVVTGTETTIEREVRNAIAASEPVALGVTAEAAALPTKTLSSVASEDVLREFPDRPPDAYDPATLTPGRDWLWPPQDHSPAIPNTKVAIKHSVGERISLTLNGIPVDVLNFDGVDRDPNGDIVVSRWRGLDLADGANLLVARVLTDDGEEVVLERRLHFAGTPVRGSLLVERSALVADGKSRPVLVLRLEDRWGKPAREGATGQFEIGGPYRSWWEVERLRDSPIVSTADQSPTYVVGADGIALIELEPTTTTGQVELVLKYPHDQDQTFRAYVEPGARDWILVGLAEGTVAWNRVAGNLEVARGSGFDNNYYDEGRLAFYAKGRVKGAVITAALDSSGDRDDRFDAFGGVIDPDLYYTVYGDDTDQRFDAPSRERLYLKLERGTFHAMFGDFETGLTVTELSRYSRSMTGFRSERHGERVSYSAFAARSDSAFMRDEIRGDGTSGPYRLQSDSIVAGSDKIAVEARDRFRPERIVASRVLRRHFDYDIDYVSGALFLREPLASRDFDFNPQFLVVDYEVESTAAREDGGVVAGGRVAVALGDIEGSEVGVTVIDDATTGAEGRLAGADLRYLITPDLEVGVEVARSVTTDISGAEEDGAAYSVKVAHRTSTRQVEAYVRETEAAFGLGQQRAFEPGTRRSGVAMRNELGPEWLVEAEAFRQNNLIDSNTRTVIETESRYEAAERDGVFRHPAYRRDRGRRVAAAGPGIRRRQLAAVRRPADDADQPRGYADGWSAKR